MPAGDADPASPAAPECPFCDAAGAELVAPFGSQIITSQWRCRSCGTYFEAVRDDFSDAGAGAEPAA
jgi:hypothetical protein